MLLSVLYNVGFTYFFLKVRQIQYSRFSKSIILNNNTTDGLPVFRRIDRAAILSFLCLP